MKKDNTLSFNQFVYESKRLNASSMFTKPLLITFDYKHGDVERIQDYSTKRVYAAHDLPLVEWLEIEKRAEQEALALNLL